MRREVELVAGAVLLALVIVSIVFLSSLRLPTKCEAQVRVYEDGTWSGLAMTNGEEVIDPNWYENVERWDYPPTHEGKPCTMTITNG